MDNQFVYGVISSGLAFLVILLGCLWIRSSEISALSKSGEFFEIRGSGRYRLISPIDLRRLMESERNRAQCITLNGHQLYEALQIVMPDIGEPMQLESELTIFCGMGVIDEEGARAHGLFAHMTEYPEDGSYHLESEPTPAEAKEYERLQAKTLVDRMTTLSVCEPVEGEMVHADIDGAALIASTSLSARRKALQDAARVVRTEVYSLGGDMADGGYTIEAIDGLLERRAKQIEELGA